uniref:Small RNA binding exonuclease protection factor La n=1 Tax=Chlorocebus sabaeus TaxID=60711 RepID=A0A0D9S0K8_CHLSB
MAENGDNEKMAALEAQICRQIEYYFGDFNLPRDKLLREQMKLDEGWVSLEIMIKFNRLNCLTTDFNVIVETLSKSEAELMEISEDKTKIRRSLSKPLPEVTDEYKNDVNRSVYIKGFQTDATLDDTKEWLEDKGQVLNTQMRRTLHKTFKGSIFVVFDSIESTKKFVEAPGQKYKDTGLLILFKDNYFANEVRKQNKVEAKLRAKREQEANQKLEEDAEMKSLEKKIGCLLKFSGDLDDQTCREDLHILFSNHGEIKWIDFIRGAKEGIILFKVKAKEALGKAKDANNGNLQLWNKEVTWEVLEGEVEKEALKKITEDQQESLNIWKSKGCRFKGKGKGNKAAYPGSGKEKVQFQGKKMKFANDEHDENGATGPVKRAREETDKQEPTSKQQK